MGASGKPSLESLGESMLDLIAGGTISDDFADRYRKQIGEAKGAGYSKDAFFAYFNDDFIAEHWTFNSDTMGTPAEVRKFFEDNWDACPPICYE